MEWKTIFANQDTLRLLESTKQYFVYIWNAFFVWETTVTKQESVHALQPKVYFTMDIFSDCKIHFQCTFKILAQ